MHKHNAYMLILEIVLIASALYSMEERSMDTVLYHDWVLIEKAIKVANVGIYNATDKDEKSALHTLITASAECDRLLLLSNASVLSALEKLKNITFNSDDLDLIEMIMHDTREVSLAIQRKCTNRACAPS